MTREEFEAAVAAAMEKVRAKQDLLEARVASDPNRWTWALIAAIFAIPMAFLAGWFLRGGAGCC